MALPPLAMPISGAVNAAEVKDTTPMPSRNNANFFLTEASILAVGDAVKRKGQANVLFQSQYYFAQFEPHRHNVVH
jgi:hypothetical protein